MPIRDGTEAVQRPWKRASLACERILVRETERRYSRIEPNREGSGKADETDKTGNCGSYSIRERLNC